MQSVSAGITGRNSRPMSWLYLFLGGFILGTLAMNLWKNIWMRDMDLLGAAALSRLKYLEVDSRALLVYVLKERLGVLLLLGLLATTGIGSMAVSLYASWMGLTAGLFLSVSVIRYGLKGILLVLAGILPQGLLLVPAYLMFMGWCCRLCEELHSPFRFYEQGREKRGRGRLKNLLCVFCIAGVVIIAGLLESYVNPIVLNFALKIF